MSNLIRAYNKKSEQTLKAARLLFEHGFLEESVTLGYYAMYHKATALLCKANLRTSSHVKTIRLLQLFNVDEQKLREAKKERVNKQYYVDVTVARKEVREFLENAREFINEVDLAIDSLTEEQIQEIRQKAT